VNNTCFSAVSTEGFPQKTDRYLWSGWGNYPATTLLLTHMWCYELFPSKPIQLTTSHGENKIYKKWHIWRIQMQKPLRAIWNFLVEWFYQACIMNLKIEGGKKKHSPEVHFIFGGLNQHLKYILAIKKYIHVENIK